MNATLSINGKSGLFVIAGVITFLILGLVFLLEGDAPIVLGGIVALIAGLTYIVSNPQVIPYLFLAITLLVFDNQDGLQVPELIYFTLSSALIGVVLIPRLLSGKMKPVNMLDKSFYFLIFVTFFGLFIGLLFTPGLNPISEYTYFLPVYGYFFYRYSENPEQSMRWLLTIFVFLCVYVIIRNFLNYQQILLDAVADWEVEKARVAKEETMVMAACMLGGLYYLFGKNVWHKLLGLGFTGVSFAGLILTQSRGFWVAALFGFGVIFLMVERKKKLEVLAVVGVLGLVGFLIAQLFFTEKFDLVLRGITERFSSLGTGQVDVSLYERYLESIQVISMMVDNPITGYGLAFPYHRYDTNIFRYRIFSYVHNGYIGVWFKFGLLGLSAIAVLFWSYFAYARRILKQTDNSFTRVLVLFSIGMCAALLLVNNTSAIFYDFPGYTTIALTAAFISIEYEKIKPL